MNVNTVAQAKIEPISLPIPAAVAATGLSRSGLYRAAAEGKLLFRKAGRTTLVDAASLRAFVSSLPVAEIGGRTA